MPAKMTKPSDEINIEEYMETLRKKVDERLDYIMERYEFLEFLEPIRYTMAGTKGGKKIRPTLATMICQSLGGQSDDKTLEVSVIVELVHQGSLVIDDIIDGDAERRGQQAMWMIQQVGGTAVTGLIMFLAANKIGLHRVPRAKNLVMEVVEALAKGNKIDMEGFGWDEKRYNDMIYLKTAYLYGAAAKFGAIMADASDEVVAKSFEYGKNIGMVYQLVDDLTDILKTEKMNILIGDMKRGKVTLTQIDMFNKDKKSHKLLEKFRAKQFTQEDIPEFFKLSHKIGSINVVNDAVSAHLNSALSVLQSFPNNRYTNALKVLPEYMKNALMKEV